MTQNINVLKSRDLDYILIQLFNHDACLKSVCCTTVFENYVSLNTDVPREQQNVPRFLCTFSVNDKLHNTSFHLSL